MRPAAQSHGAPVSFPLGTPRTVSSTSNATASVSATTTKLTNVTGHGDPAAAPTLPFSADWIATAIPATR
jgi:hypothetical protein